MNRYIVSSLEQQLRNDPTSRVFLRLAEEFRKGGFYDKAVRVCEDGLRHHPRYVPAWVCLGRCYESLGQPGEAESAFTKVLESAPDNPHALRGLGVIVLGRKEFEQARTYFERLLIQEPADEQILDWLQQCEDGALQEEAARMAEDIDPTRTMEMAKGSREMLLGDASATAAVPADALPPRPPAPVQAETSGDSGYITDPMSDEDDLEELETVRFDAPTDEDHDSARAEDDLDELDDLDDIDDLEELDEDDLEDLDEDDFLDDDAFELEEDDEDDLDATVSDTVAGIPIEGHETSSFDQLDGQDQTSDNTWSADEPRLDASAVGEAPAEAASSDAGGAPETPLADLPAASFTAESQEDPGSLGPDEALDAAAPDEALLDDVDPDIPAGLAALDAVAEEAALAASAQEKDQLDFDLDPEASVEAEVTASLLADVGDAGGEAEMDAIDLHFERALSEGGDSLLEEDLVVAAKQAPVDEPLSADPLSSEEFESKMTQGLKHEKMEHLEQAEQIYRLLLRHRPGDVVVTGHLQRLLGVLAAESKKRKKIRKLSNWLDKIKGVYDVS